MRAIEILAIGMATIDFINEVDRFPEEGSTSRVRQASTCIGGTAGRAALACGYLGAKTVFAGMIGRGVYADLLRTQLASEPLESRLVVSESDPTSQHSFVLLSGEAGERTILWTPQPRVSSACLAVCKELIPKARCVLMDATDLDLALTAAHWCRVYRVPLIFDTGSYKPDADVILPLVDYIIGPVKYFRTRAATRGQSYSDALVDTFRKFGPRLIMATEGESGGTYIDANSPGLRRYDAVPVKAVDSCGAGDVFHGGFAYGIAQGWPLKKTIDFSAWLAAEKCTAVGNAALPTAPRIPAHFVD